MATDNHGKQPIRTLVDGDASVGILDSLNVRISPSLEGGNLLDIKTSIGSTVAPAAGTTNKLLTDILADTTSLASNVFFDVDDGSILAGQSSNLDVALNYGYNGVTWERITSTSGRLNVDISAATDLDIRDLTNATDNILVYGWDGLANQKIKTDAGGELQIDVLSSALPSGAATSAHQVTSNASLSSIDTKIPADPAREGGNLASIKAKTDGLTFSGSDLRVTIPTAIAVNAAPTVSTLNSSSTPLGSSATFTGTAEEVLNFSTVSVFAYADQNSATDGLVIEWSSDGTNFDSNDTYTITPTGTKVFTFGVVARYIRVRFINGAVAQGVFRLQTILHPLDIKPSTHRLSDTLSLQNDGELVISTMWGLDPSGTSMGPVRITSEGKLRVDATVAAADAALNDKVFSTDTTAITQLSATEQPAFRITNPSGSGKELKVERISYVSYDNTNVVFRLYKNPTTVSGGTARTPSNNLVGSSVTSDMTTATVPTVATNGTLVAANLTSSSLQLTELRGSFVIQENNTVLFTTEPQGANKRWSINIQWIEE